jgi:DNA-binding CsgD family transcriptional regulator
MHPETSAPGGAGLVERERELRRIGALIAAVAEGAAGALVIEGPAGIGKTSLLAAARGRARAARVRVLGARASELERGFPFGSARQWFEPAVAAASPAQRRRLFDGAARVARAVVAPGGTPVEPAPSPAILHSLYWLTANLAAREPLLLTLDDAQWADEASLRLLNYLLPRCEGIRVGLLAACRPPDIDEEGELLSRLLATDEVEIARPGALSVEGAALILAERTGQQPERPFTEACRAATGGNPFYLGELVQWLAEEGVAPTADHVHRIGEARPQFLSRTVLMRISAPARELAQALALLDGPAELELAGAIAGLNRGAAPAAANELTRAGLVADRQPLELVHAIVRAAVLSGLSGPERARQHARAAGLLRDRGASAEEISAHLLVTEPASDAEVVATLLEAAGMALARGAPEAAVRLLRRALLEPPTEDARVSVLLDLGSAEREAHAPEAADRFREAYRLSSDPLVRGEALRRLAWTDLYDQQHLQQMGEDLDRAIAAVEPLDRELALALEGARLGGLMISPGKREELGARLQALGELEGATHGECVLLAMLARYRLDAGRPAREVAVAVERAAANPQALEVLGPDSLWLLNCAIALAECERFEQLDALLERALELARQRSLSAAFAFVSANRARVAYKRGKLRDAEAEARAALDSGGLFKWYRQAASSLLIAALASQGKLDDAQAAYDATGFGERLPEQRPFTPLLISRGVLRHAQGHRERAVIDLREALERIARYATGTTAGMDARLLLATTLHELGRAEEALVQAEEALALARAWGTPGMVGMALRARALAAGGENRVDQLHAAVEHLASSPLRLEHARALIDLGAALRRAGRRADCRRPLRTGLDIADRAGAEPLAQFAREELSASGVRVPRHHVGDELTPSERRIVDMAAAGMSNPQIAQALFVTIKTVESHLGRAYLKLGVKSRRELSKALETSSAPPSK